ncbi:hypothetical protein B0H14DRAFT_2656314 [Mycena olivaceomarginata]|nr:hypothetical protein B0H14DRAFT_2656314 [Mycena olivaceomarginata]
MYGRGTGSSAAKDRRGACWGPSWLRRGWTQRRDRTKWAWQSKNRRAAAVWGWDRRGAWSGHSGGGTERAWQHTRWVVWTRGVTGAWRRGWGVCSGGSRRRARGTRSGQGEYWGRARRNGQGQVWNGRRGIRSGRVFEVGFAGYLKRAQAGTRGDMARVPAAAQAAWAGHAEYGKRAGEVRRAKDNRWAQRGEKGVSAMGNGGLSGWGWGMMMLMVAKSATEAGVERRGRYLAQMLAMGRAAKKMVRCVKRIIQREATTLLCY